jgi:mono/diheme cytochrome c family protein
MLLLATLLLSGASVHAADVAKGRALHDKSCVSCHMSLMKGKASLIYTRPDRRIQTYQGLVAHVKRCAATIGVDWSEASVQDVAAFLNQEYYKF